jgi:Uma2 family endonuclease
MSRLISRTNESIPADLANLTKVITPERFEELCRDHSDLRLELTSTGELIVMPPAGNNTSMRNANLTYQLAAWARKDGTGVCFDSSTIFALPNNARRSPDAAWLRRATWDSLSERQQEGFAPVCPDFVIELRSRTDNLAPLFQQDVGIYGEWRVTGLVNRSKEPAGLRLQTGSECCNP